MSNHQRLNPPPLLLGVEGGGTRTVAILADQQMRLVQRTEAGPANLKLLSETQLTRHLRGLARQLPAPAGLCIGLAGLRTDQDRARVLAAAARVWPNVPCRACADVETALAAAEAPAKGPRLPQVLVLSGTGSCCYGRGLDGCTAKIGGWGHLLGDKGSGYEIGLRALKAVVYYYDRDGVWPKLGAGILNALQLNDPNALVPWIQQATKSDVAALALEVFAAWTRQDKIAADILQSAAQSLAKDGAACAKRLVSKGGPVQFILAGSVLLKQPRFARLTTEALLKFWPGGVVSSLKVESAWGAVRLAQAEFARESSHSQPVQIGAEAAPDSRGQDVLGPYATASQASSLIGFTFIPEATALSPTERRNPRSMRLDKMPVVRAIDLMLSEEAKVAPALLAHRKEIGRCIQAIVGAFREGGRLFYVGAGTSGRLGALDASECPPTFRAAADQVQGIMAGGQEALWQSIEGAEDDTAAGGRAVEFRGIGTRDIVVGIAASGRTPFVWGALHQARSLGAKTVFVCFNPYLKIPPAHRPDFMLAVDLGPEVLTGSTRLKAGTATKLLLNAFTTLAMVQLGKVVSNLMVDLNPSNRKLRQRAIRIVSELTGVSDREAAQALEKTRWVVKAALKEVEHSRQRRRNVSA